MNILYTYVTTKNVDIAYSEFSKEELMECILALRTTYFRLKEENEQLKMINKEYERLNKEKYRGFKIINVQEYNIDELLSYKKYKDNWNKLKEYVKEVTSTDNELYGTDLLSEMQELEGSDK